MKTVCEQKKCVGCRACVEICPKGAVSVHDFLTFYEAVINKEKCIDCDACHNVCQVNNPVKLRTIQKWCQGWAADEEIRVKSSSGGLAAAISKAFVEKCGSVCSCVFYNGEFGFQFAESVDETAKFRGSKYVKSNPSGIYEQIRERLSRGKKVLFIGLPCQVAAVKKYMNGRFDDQLYTIDLICHGTPSSRILNQFLKENGYDIKKLDVLYFRKKGRSGISYYLSGKHGCISKAEVMDAYLMAFLRGICYTENCYQCIYAQKQRCADMTLGDSWGSELSIIERRKGISLVLCNTQKGVDLLDMTDLTLLDVDLENAMNANTQLRMPCPKPQNYTYFFDSIKKGKSLNYVMFRCYPKAMLKNRIKSILVRLGIRKPYC